MNLMDEQAMDVIETALVTMGVCVRTGACDHQSLFMEVFWS